MKRGFYTFVIMMMLMACSEKEQLARQEMASVCFSLSRAETEAATRLQIRLYVAQSAKEAQTENYTDLYCDAGSRYLLNDANSFTLTDLYLQWYKFCFVGVPDYEGVMDGRKMFTDLTAAPNTVDKETNDFTQLKIDLNPIKEYLTVHQNGAKEYDLSIYRGIVNRWTNRPDADGGVIKEIVSLERINGQLDLVMGNLTDQFPEPVQHISIRFLDMPYKVYVHDNAIVEGTDEIIVDNTSKEDWTYTYNVSEEERSGKKKCILSLPLLPQRLLGANLIVKVQKDGPEKLYIFNIGTENSQPVTIKRNTKTKLLFHGMHKGQFEVQYAGFDNSGISVEDDVWTGWE